MKEIFVLYDSAGEIKSAGRIDLDWCDANRDGSTAFEYIKRKIAEDPNLYVLYLPEQDLPDPIKQKVENGKIINK